jgi:hypothetical protein
LRGFCGVSRSFGLIALATVALAICGCGGSSDSTTGSTAGRYVSAATLEHAKPGTPARATLDWWRAVQFGNPEVARRLYAPGIAPEVTQLKRELTAASSQFVGVPQFNSADVHGHTGTMYFFLSRPGSTTPPRPLSINLRKVHGNWLLADNLLLEQQVARVAKLLRASDESGD